MTTVLALVALYFVMGLVGSGFFWSGKPDFYTDGIHVTGDSVETERRLALALRAWKTSRREWQSEYERLLALPKS